MEKALAFPSDRTGPATGTVSSYGTAAEASLALPGVPSPAVSPFDGLLVRAVCASARLVPSDLAAFRALRRATQLFSILLGHRLGELRESLGSPVRAEARILELTYQLDLAWQAADLLAARLRKLPEHRRPQYTPEQRFAILRVKDALLLSADETAQRFALSGSTIHRWTAEERRHPGDSRVGSLLRPVPPVRRYADVVRHLVDHLSRLGLGGAGRIAHELARIGWKVSKRAVARYRQERPVVPAPPPLAPPSSLSRADQSPVRAKRPLEKVVVDVTVVRSLFGLVSCRLALVLDVFSRFPLAFRLFRTEPSAAEMAGLLAKARRYGPIGVLVSDHGAAFTAGLFRSAVRTLRIEHRFGAVGSPRSTALVERLWRTLKASLALPLVRPLALVDLERRVGRGLLHYAYFRPHQALRGATPAEVFFRLPPASLHAVPPPRGRPGEVVAFPSYRVDHLDPERRLPVVRRQAA